jgi:hypothetical protein
MQHARPLQKETVKAIDDCFAEVLREFDQPINLPLGLKSLVKEVYYSHISRWLRAWAHANKCSYPDCDRITGISSHTIQKSGALRLISENGHVLCPRINKDNLHLTMESVGLNEASTFTGFCEEHEQMFTFERNKTLATNEDYEQQVFRTVCRELRMLRHSVLSFKDALALYKKRAMAEILMSRLYRLQSGVLA